MKRYIKYAMAILLASFATSCHTGLGDDVEVKSHLKPAIVLNIDGGMLGANTRAEGIADSDRESAISHLDIMIFNDAEDDANKSLFYHERATTATSNGQVRLGVDIGDITVGAKYWVYVVANSTLAASSYANIGSVEALFDLKEENHNVHLTATGLQNTHSHFLMDGAGYMGTTEPSRATAITLAEQQISDTVEINVKLRRAAAKVVVKLIESETIEFSDAIAGSTPGYYVRNTPYETRVMADGIVRQSEKLETTHESMSSYYEWMRDASGDINGVKVTLYILSHTWQTNDSFNYATNLIVDVPALYNTMQEGARLSKPHPNNYYQIPMTKEFKFERNHYYEVTANVHAPGAEDFSEPVTIDDLKYSVQPWTEHTIDIGGMNGPEYLKVNLDELKIFNTDIDSSSLLFSSSSPVTISVTDCYYIDKFGRRVNINADTYHISGSTANGAVSGNITVRSDEPTNNTIRYFTLIITNQTGQQERVLVEQYPLVYIVNILGHYSYRDDFKSDNNTATTYYNKGSRIVSVSLGSYNNGKWSYNYSTSAGTGFWSSKVATKNYPEDSGDDAFRGRSKIQYYYWNNNANAASIGNNTDDPGNARMYHIRITATSGDYNLGLPRMVNDGVQSYTDIGADNAKIVSPSFMTASRLSKVDIQNYGSGLNSDERRYAMAREHCANYVEVDQSGNVYDNWRLPTASELGIIVKLQGTKSQSADAIDYLLDADYYMSASGLVENPGRSNSGNYNKSVWAIRCIRDAY